MDEQEYIANRLDDQIDWYGGKSTKCQRIYKASKIIEMILSASIPIIMLIWDNNWYAKIFVGIAGAVIVVLSGIHGLCNYHENWIEYRATSETLKHEKFMYLTHSGIYADPNNQFSTLVERVESIISHENINWAQLNSVTPPCTSNQAPPM